MNAKKLRLLASAVEVCGDEALTRILQLLVDSPEARYFLMEEGLKEKLRAARDLYWLNFWQNAAGNDRGGKIFKALQWIYKSPGKLCNPQKYGEEVEKLFHAISDPFICNMNDKGNWHEGNKTLPALPEWRRLIQAEPKFSEDISRAIDEFGLWFGKVFVARNGFPASLAGLQNGFKVVVGYTVREILFQEELTPDIKAFIKLWKKGLLYMLHTQNTRPVLLVE